MELETPRNSNPDTPPVKPREDRGRYVLDPAVGLDSISPSWAIWFRLLVEHANDLIYLHNPEGKLLFVNRRLEQATGWSRDEIVGRNLLEFLAPDYRPSALARREGVSMPDGGRRYETEVICRDGSRIPLEVHSTPVKHNGETIAWQGIARDIRERRQAQARMNALYETARQVVGILHLDQVLKVIVSHAAEITGALSCTVWMPDEERETLYCSAYGGTAGVAEGERIAITSDDPLAEAFRSRQATVRDVGDGLLAGAAALPPDVTSMVGFPLISAEGVLGVLGLCYGRPSHPSPDEVALLSIFANHAAAAIANARLFEAQRRKTQEAAAIGQVGMAIGTLDVEAALRVTGAYAYDLFSADLAAVLVLDQDRSTLHTAFIADRHRKVTDEQFQEVYRLEEHPLLAEAIQNDRTVVTDAVAHPLMRDGDGARGKGVATSLVVPMSSRSEVDGALVICYREHTRVSDVRIRLAETLAQQAAVAIDNAMLFRATEAAKREWEATFDAIRDPVYIFSTEGRLLRANRAAGAMLGREVASLIGRHYLELLHGGRAPTPIDIFAECLVQGQPVTREVEDLSVPGAFQVSAYPLFDDTGKCVGVVEYLKDVTAQREMQARLYHSARLAGVGELAAGVVHNFKNVLMGVSGMLDVALMLMERGGSMDAVRERLVDAQGHVFRGNQVLQRLLDFARGIPQEVADVHLDVLLPDVVALCKAHPASRGIRIRAELPANLPPVRADASQLHEVLVNLVLNALQAIAGGGTVTVDAACEGDRVIIRVKDTGCGIPPEEIERIFEPFYSHRMHGPPGSGIGLSSSLRMIRAMGGDIRVESQVGVGTSFIVALPWGAGE
ncbi:MAG TPA: PAS domain S-box protein [Armatimonadetes bacterium]|jgi:two-component system NtrC family sensor kinase|nr:PAS domain S-box protein [Armatimonadota bacterium]